MTQRLNGSPAPRGQCQAVSQCSAKSEWLCRLDVWLDPLDAGRHTRREG